MRIIKKFHIAILSVLVFSGCGSNEKERFSTLNDVTGGAKPQQPLPTLMEYPGLIPLAGMRSPASDLVHKEQTISPETAAKLRASGTDISQLNPREDTDLWRDTVGGTLQPELDALEVSENDIVLFQGFLTSLSNTRNARFGVRKTSGGENQSFTLSVGRNVHDVLLRRSLLRKLGYIISPTKYLPRITLKFNNIREVELFKKRIAEDTVADPSRWLVSQPDSLTIIVQDIVAVEAQVTKYNLANGRVAGRAGGRRLMRSLIVPFSVVSMGENANLFSWVAGRVFDNHIFQNS